VFVAVVEESNYSDHQAATKQPEFKGYPSVVGSGEGDEWEVRLLSMGKLLNLEAYVCVGQQHHNNSLEELNLVRSCLTDEFTADKTFMHLSKLKKIDLSSGKFSMTGIAAISELIQVQSSLSCGLFPFDRSFGHTHFQLSNSSSCFCID